MDGGPAVTRSKNKYVLNLIQLESKAISYCHAVTPFNSFSVRATLFILLLL